MQPQTIIIMGPSGSGKGTQASLLCNYLEQQEPDRDVLYVRVGKRFRDLAEEKSLTARLIDGYINEGLLVPEFLTVWAWSQALILDCKNNQDLIFDGTPRRLKEADMLQGALRFYKRENPLVIVLSVSKEWSRERLSERKREDDVDVRDVERRLKWYDTDVIPVIAYFKEAEGYEVIEINGEQPIEAVHHDIVAEVVKRNG